MGLTSDRTLGLAASRFKRPEIEPKADSLDDALGDASLGVMKWQP
jgi:hypothetical protein